MYVAIENVNAIDKRASKPLKKNSRLQLFASDRRLLRAFIDCRLFDVVLIYVEYQNHMIWLILQAESI